MVRTQVLFRTRPLWFVVVITLLGIVFNGFLNLLNTTLNLPLFFDSIGTAVIAALFGPLAGVVVGLLTNLFLELLYGFPWIHAPFALCGVATALIVGYMAKARRFNTLFDAVIVSLLVTLANSVLGAVIATFLFGGITGVAIDYLVTGFLVSGQSILSATFWARIPANLIDKTIAVFTALLLRQAVHLEEHQRFWRTDSRG